MAYDPSRVFPPGGRVDSLGLLVAVLVTLAAVDDGVAAKEVLAQVESDSFPRFANDVCRQQVSQLRPL